MSVLSASTLTLPSASIRSNHNTTLALSSITSPNKQQRSATPSGLSSSGILPLSSVPLLTNTPCTQCTQYGSCAGCLSAETVRIAAVHHRILHPSAIPLPVDTNDANLLPKPLKKHLIPAVFSQSKIADAALEAATQHTAARAFQQWNNAHTHDAATADDEAELNNLQEFTSPIRSHIHPSISIDRPNPLVSPMRLERPATANKSDDADALQRASKGASMLQSMLEMKASDEARMSIARELSALEARERAAASQALYVATTASPFYHSKAMHRVGSSAAATHSRSPSKTLQPLAASSTTIVDPLQEALTAANYFGAPQGAKNIEAARAKALEGTSLMTSAEIQLALERQLNPFASGSSIPRMLEERAQAAQELVEQDWQHQEEVTAELAENAKEAAFQMRRAKFFQADEKPKVVHNRMLEPRPVRGFVLRLKDKTLPNNLLIVAKPEARPIEAPNPHLHLPPKTDEELEEEAQRQRAGRGSRKPRLNEYHPVMTTGLKTPQQHEEEQMRLNQAAQAALIQAYEVLRTSSSQSNSRGGGSAAATDSTNIDVEKAEAMAAQIHQHLQQQRHSATHSHSSSLDANMHKGSREEEKYADHSLYHSEGDHSHSPARASRSRSSPRSSTGARPAAGIFFHSPHARELQNALIGTVPSPYSVPKDSPTGRVLVDDILGVYAKSQLGQLQALTSRTKHFHTQHDLKKKHEDEALAKIYKESRKGHRWIQDPVAADLKEALVREEHSIIAASSVPVPIPHYHPEMLHDEQAAVAYHFHNHQEPHSESHSPFEGHSIDPHANSAQHTTHGSTVEIEDEDAVGIEEGAAEAVDDIDEGNPESDSPQPERQASPLVDEAAEQSATPNVEVEPVSAAEEQPTTNSDSAGTSKSRSPDMTTEQPHAEHPPSHHPHAQSITFNDAATAVHIGHSMHPPSRPRSEQSSVRHHHHQPHPPHLHHGSQFHNHHHHIHHGHASHRLHGADTSAEGSTATSLHIGHSVSQSPAAMGSEPHRPASESTARRGEQVHGDSRAIMMHGRAGSASSGTVVHGSTKERSPPRSATPTSAPSISAISALPESSLPSLVQSAPIHAPEEGPAARRGEFLHALHEKAHAAAHAMSEEQRKREAKAAARAEKRAASEAAAAAAAASKADEETKSAQQQGAKIFRAYEHVDASGVPVMPSQPLSARPIATAPENARRNPTYDALMQNMDEFVYKGYDATELPQTKSQLNQAVENVLTTRSMLPQGPQMALRNNAAPASSRVRTSRIAAVQSAQQRAQTARSAAPIMQVKALSSTTPLNGENEEADQDVPADAGFMRNSMLKSTMAHAQTARVSRPRTQSKSRSPERRFMLTMNAPFETSDAAGLGHDSSHVRERNFSLTIPRSFPSRPALGRKQSSVGYGYDDSLDLGGELDASAPITGTTRQLIRAAQEKAALDREFPGRAQPSTSAKAAFLVSQFTSKLTGGKLGKALRRATIAKKQAIAKPVIAPKLTIDTDDGNGGGSAGNSAPLSTTTPGSMKFRRNWLDIKLGSPGPDRAALIQERQRALAREIHMRQMAERNERDQMQFGKYEEENDIVSSFTSMAAIASRTPRGPVMVQNELRVETKPTHSVPIPEGVDQYQRRRPMINHPKVPRVSSVVSSPLQSPGSNGVNPWSTRAKDKPKVTMEAPSAPAVADASQQPLAVMKAPVPIVAIPTASTVQQSSIAPTGLSYAEALEAMNAMNH